MDHKIKPSVGIITFIAASLFLCYEMGLQVAPAVVTSPLMKALHVNAAHLGWLSSCYFLAYTIMQIPGGLLFDRFACRNIMVGSALCCTLGALLFATTPVLPLIFLSRFLIGAGSAFPFVGVLVVAAKCFRPALFPVFVGVTQGLAALGAFIGTAPLSALVDHAGWQHAMLYCGVLGLLIVVLLRVGMAKLPTQRQTGTTIQKDLKQIVQQRQSWIIAAYAFLNWGPVIILTSLWGEPFLVRKMHVDTTHAALIVQNIWLGIGFGSVLLGLLAKRFNCRIPFMILCACLGLMCTLVCIYAPVHGVWLQSFLFFAIGVAASGQILSFALVKSLHPEEIAGTAIGFNNMAVVAGGFILQPIIGECMQLFWHGKMLQGVPFYQLITFQKALSLAPLCFFLCVIVSLFLKDEEGNANA